MDNYASMLMTNHIFNSESSDDLYYLYSEKENQTGGAKHIQKTPRGGFPPIYIIDSNEKEKEVSKNRQLSSNKSSISIKDILKSKK
jgi:hypothetical protein